MNMKESGSSWFRLDFVDLSRKLKKDLPVEVFLLIPLADISPSRTKIKQFSHLAILADQETFVCNVPNLNLF